MPTAYEGDKPYIFISYAHKDKAEVLRYVDALEKSGFRIWFDGGIEVGSEWPEYIATHLANSTCVMAFISPNFVESDNCRRELSFAQELKKEQLNVYIKKSELPLGLRMQLGLNQAIWRENFSTEEAFVAELCKARMLGDCREIAPKEVPAEVKPEKEKKPAATPKMIRSCKRLGLLGMLLEAIYIPASLCIMQTMSAQGISGWWMFISIAILHIGISLINRLLFTPLRRKFQNAQVDKTPLDNWVYSITIVLVLGTLVSIVGGAIYLQMEINFLLRLLIALGLNVVPGVVAGLITLFLAD